MSAASSRMIFGSTQHNPPSRFLSDIESTVVAPSTSAYSAQANSEPYIVSEEIDLAVGDGVRHGVFGNGLVTHIDGSVVTVAFRGKGIKKLNVAFAPLEKV